LINLALTCWGFVTAMFFAMTSSRFRRRVVYLVCSLVYAYAVTDLYQTGTLSILLIFTGWTIASARFAIAHDQGSSRAVIAFIFLYQPAYNMAFNALTYSTSPLTFHSYIKTDLFVAYLVEVFPFHVRAKGIAIFQVFSRLAGFFNQFVNPIGIENSGWKYYIRSAASQFIWILN
jgi:hypothetical protein